MSLDIEKIKKRIFFRSSHRGSKEMDFLMISFVKSIINKLDTKELLILDKFVNLDDEEILKIKRESSFFNNQDNNIIYKLFIDFKLK